MGANHPPNLDKHSGGPEHRKAGSKPRWAAARSEVPAKPHQSLLPVCFFAKKKKKKIKKIKINTKPDDVSCCRGTKEPGLYSPRRKAEE